MNNNPFYKQPISNSPIFPEIERKVNIVAFCPNSDTETFEFFYRILYYKNGQDVSYLFPSQPPNWNINNSQLMMCRDDNFQPILNPEFVEQRDERNNILNEIERYITMPGFDYIKRLMLDMNIPLKAILSAYITEEDKDGRFNF